MLTVETCALCKVQVAKPVTAKHGVVCLVMVNLLTHCNMQSLFNTVSVKAACTRWQRFTVCICVQRLQLSILTLAHSCSGQKCMCGEATHRIGASADLHGTDNWNDNGHNGTLKLRTWTLHAALT